MSEPIHGPINALRSAFASPPINWCMTIVAAPYQTRASDWTATDTENTQGKEGDDVLPSLRLIVPSLMTRVAFICMCALPPKQKYATFGGDMM